MIKNVLSFEKILLGSIALVASVLCLSFWTYTQSSPEEIVEAASKAFEKGDESTWSTKEWLAIDEHRSLRAAEKIAAADQVFIDRKKTGRQLFWTEGDKVVIAKTTLEKQPVFIGLTKEHPWMVTTITIPGKEGQMVLYVAPEDDLSIISEIGVYEKQEQPGFYYALPQEGEAQLAQK